MKHRVDLNGNRFYQTYKSTSWISEESISFHSLNQYWKKLPFNERPMIIQKSTSSAKRMYSADQTDHKIYKSMKTSVDHDLTRPSAPAKYLNNNSLSETDTVDSECSIELSSSDNDDNFLLMKASAFYPEIKSAGAVIKIKSNVPPIYDQTNSENDLASVQGNSNDSSSSDYELSSDHQEVDITEVQNNKQRGEKIQPPPKNMISYKWNHGFSVGDVVWISRIISTSSTPKSIILWPCMIQKKIAVSSYNDQKLDGGESNSINIPQKYLFIDKSAESKNNSHPIISPSDTRMSESDETTSSSSSDSNVLTNSEMILKLTASIKKKFSKLTEHRYSYEVLLYPLDKSSAPLKVMDKNLLPFGYIKVRPSKFIDHNVAVIQAMALACTWAVPEPRKNPIINHEPFRRITVSFAPSSPEKKKKGLFVPVKNPFLLNKKSSKYISHNVYIHDDGDLKYHRIVRVTSPKPQPPFGYQGRGTDSSEFAVQIDSLRLGADVIHVGDLVRIGTSKLQNEYFCIESMLHIKSKDNGDRVELQGEKFKAHQAVINENSTNYPISLVWAGAGQRETIDADIVVGKYHFNFPELFGVPVKRNLASWDGTPLSKPRVRLRIDWDEYDGTLYDS